MKTANTPAAMKALIESCGFTVDAIADDVTPVDQAPLPPPAPTAPPLREKSRRHRGWVRLREHVYICPACGTGKEHIRRKGDWITVWHLPTGQSVELRATPPCEPGPKTAKALEKHAATIAAGGVKKGSK